MKKYILYITLLFSVNLISQELNLKGQVFEKETDIGEFADYLFGKIKMNYHHAEGPPTIH